MSLTYIGALGRDLLRVTDLANPNADFQNVGVASGTAASDYHALQLKFQRRLLHGLQALASYTFSHSIDTASTDAFADYLNTPNFLGNPDIDRGNSDFDVRHAFTAGVTYELPSPAERRALRMAFGGWAVDTFALARTAPPVDIVCPQFSAAGTDLDPRANLNQAVPVILYDSQYPGGKAFNSAAFSCPPAGEQGDFKRNVLRAFGAWQADFALQRQFRLREQVGLRFRAEFFNIFNHTNFGPPDNTLGDALFGQSTQTLANSLGSGGANGGFSPLYQIGGPRSVQFALKLSF